MKNPLFVCSALVLVSIGLFLFSSLPEGDLRTSLVDRSSKVVLQGHGFPAETGDSVSIHYHFEDESGNVVASSYLSGQKLSFTIGSGIMSSALEASVMGMKAGGRKRVSFSAQDIAQLLPSDVTTSVVGEIELVEVR